MKLEEKLQKSFDVWARENAIDTTRLPHGAYRSMVTHFAHKAWLVNDAIKLFGNTPKNPLSNIPDNPSPSETPKLTFSGSTKEPPSVITIPAVDPTEKVITLSLTPEERQEIFQEACSKVPWKKTSTTPPVPPKAPPTRILSDAPLRSGPSLWQRFTTMLRLIIY